MIRDMKNAIIGILATALVFVVGAMIFMNKPSVGTNVAESPVPGVAITSAPEQNIYPSASADVSPNNHTVAMGTVTGKLCYPSSSLPKGSIEAKDINTSAISIQPYLGSQNGGKSSYSFDLPTGTYILRYKAEASADIVLYGYHTETCAKGTETTCAAANPRAQIKAAVKAGETTSSIDLCDFYYDQKNPPIF